MLWKLLTIVFATGCIVLLVLVVKSRSNPRLTDPRLFGTWKSDRERTLNALWSQTSEESRERLGHLFGKLTVTYTDTTLTAEMDGFTETVPYTVLGIDKHSVVIRNDAPPKKEEEFLQLSSFSKIQFDGEDTYWVTTEISGFTEYFRRVSNIKQ